MRLAFNFLAGIFVCLVLSVCKFLFGKPKSITKYLNKYFPIN